MSGLNKTTLLTFTLIFASCTIPLSYAVRCTSALSESCSTTDMMTGICDAGKCLCDDGLPGMFGCQDQWTAEIVADHPYTSGVVMPGQILTLRCAPASQVDPSYKWFKDGLEMIGETGERLMVSNSGLYTCTSKIYDVWSYMSDPFTVMRIDEVFADPWQCGPGWTKNSADLPMCVRVFLSLFRWPAAKQKCISVGGHLVMVDSEMKNSFVASVLSAEASANIAWIGLERTAAGANFSWLDPDNSPLNYTNWSSGSVTTIGGMPDEICVYMTGDNGEWTAGSCDASRKQICEKDILSRLTIHGMPTSVLPGMGIELTCRNGTVHEGNQFTWHQRSATTGPYVIIDMSDHTEDIRCSDGTFRSTPVPLPIIATNIIGVELSTEDETLALLEGETYLMKCQLTGGFPKFPVNIDGTKFSDITYNWHRDGVDVGGDTWEYEISETGNYTCSAQLVGEAQVFSDSIFVNVTAIFGSVRDRIDSPVASAGFFTVYERHEYTNRSLPIRSYEWEFLDGPDGNAYTMPGYRDFMLEGYNVGEVTYYFRRKSHTDYGTLIDDFVVEAVDVDDVSDVVYLEVPLSKGEFFEVGLSYYFQCSSDYVFGGVESDWYVNTVKQTRPSSSRTFRYEPSTSVDVIYCEFNFDGEDFSSNKVNVQGNKIIYMAVKINGRVMDDNIEALAGSALSMTCDVTRSTASVTANHAITYSWTMMLETGLILTGSDSTFVVESAGSGDLLCVATVDGEPTTLRYTISVVVGISTPTISIEPNDRPVWGTQAHMGCVSSTVGNITKWTWYWEGVELDVLNNDTLKFNKVYSLYDGAYKCQITMDATASKQSQALTIDSVESPACKFASDCDLFLFDTDFCISNRCRCRNDEDVIHLGECVNPWQAEGLKEDDTCRSCDKLVPPTV